MTTQKNTKGTRVFFRIVAAIGGIIVIWPFLTLMTYLASVDWQFLVATDNLQLRETLVDFYSHYEGIGYLIMAAFFFAFPELCKALIPKEEATATTTNNSD